MSGSDDSFHTFFECDRFLKSTRSYQPADLGEDLLMDSFQRIATRSLGQWCRIEKFAKEVLETERLVLSALRRPLVSADVCHQALTA